MLRMKVCLNFTSGAFFLKTLMSKSTFNSKLGKSYRDSAN